MPLPRHYVGHVIGKRDAQILIEVYLDLICPYSRKAFYTLKSLVEKYGPAKVGVSIVQYAQPWHHQSPILHRAAITVDSIDNTKTIDMIDKIYSNFDKFVDAAVEDKSRSQIAVELADLAASLGIDKDRFLSTIFSDDITQWLKFHTRHGRQLSVHVTPTVFVNGITFPDHSSSWTLEDWGKHIDPLLH